MRIKTGLVLTIIFLTIMMLSGCKTQQEVAEEVAEYKAPAGIKETITGEWLLSGIDEETESLSGTDKEAYEEYLDTMLSLFSLTFFPDGAYSRVMANYKDRGTWRLVNGDTGIELYSDNNEYNTAYDIEDYNEPRLTLITAQDGVKKKFYLKRVN